MPVDYVRAVERAGGRPLLVPPSTDGVEETLDALDGIIFSGGADLDPALYGQERHQQTGGIVERARPRRAGAAAGGARARHAGARGLPRLAGAERRASAATSSSTCPTRSATNATSTRPAQFADHDVKLDAGTRLGALLGEHAPVKSHHHQGFGRIGDGLREAAYADDGTVEALEDPSRRFALGVLWHPEAGEDLRLFEALVAEAERYREAHG